MCRIEKAQLAHDVLAYMVEHREAQDTLEGIVEWWLMQQEIERQIADVQDVLTDLVAKDLVVQQQGPDSRIHYRINHRRENEILTLLAQSPE